MPNIATARTAASMMNADLDDIGTGVQLMVYESEVVFVKKCVNP